MSTPLPLPQRQRWQPLRSGLINIYRYDAEEFYFEDGHLLLRGNNGTGKSRVLALQLPFLLDGEVSPRRLEPDGDPSKRIEWNLLMDKYEDRCGYTWIEFGRLDDAGQAHYLTLAIGLLAIKGQGLSDRWYCVTPKRVGQDFFLQSEDRQVFGKKQLKEEFLRKGYLDVLFPDNARAYRRAVDEALFQLGEHRYEALVELLIQLRHPQLSRNLDERKLSSVLSEALPPLPQNTLNDIAESFRNLENEQKKLEDLFVVLKGLDIFSAPYRRYIQWELRQRSLKVIDSHQQTDKTQREVKKEEHNLESAQRQCRELAEQEEVQHLEQDSTQAQLFALESGPEMKEARRLDELKSQLEQMERDHGQLQHRLERSSQQVQKMQQRKNHEAETCRGHFTALQSKILNILQYSEKLPLSKETPAQLFWEDSLGENGEAPHSAMLKDSRGDLPPAQVNSEPNPKAPVPSQEVLESRMAFWKGHLSTYRQALALLDKLDQRLRETHQQLLMFRRQQDQQQGEVDQAVDELKKSQQQLAQSCQSIWQDIHNWSQNLQVLPAPPLLELQENFETWCGLVQGSDPIASNVMNAFEQCFKNLLQEQQELQRKLLDQQQTWQLYETEKKRLLQGLDVGPLSTPWKDSLRRKQREGAPLWQVIDFKSELGEMERAGLEAALEASGLLDAWVLPGGRLLNTSDGEDVFLNSSEELGHCENNLTAVLTAAIDPHSLAAQQISAAHIEKILSHIGWGRQSSSCWVEVETTENRGQGSFRLGPQVGQWAKSQAQHLGHGARAENRRRRCVELDNLMAELQTNIVESQAQAQQLQKYQTILKQEREALPSTQPIQKGHARCAQVQLQLEAQRRKMETLNQQVDEVQHQYLAIQDEMKASVEDFKLLNWLGKLGEFRNTLDTLQTELNDWEKVSLQWLASVRSVQQLRQDESEAQEQFTRDRELSKELFARLNAQRQQWQTLQQNAGQSIQQLQQQISSLRLSLEQMAKTQKLLQNQKSELERSVVRQEERLVHLNQKLEELKGEREIHLESFKQFLSTGLQELLITDPSDPASNAGLTMDAGLASHAGLTMGAESSANDLSSRASVLGHARQWLSILSAESDATINGEVLYNQAEAGIRPLENILGAQSGYRVLRYRVSEVLVVEVEHQTRHHNLSSLGRMLQAEIHHHQVVLDNQEREILEKHLIGEVAVHLHEMIHQGENWVLEVNRELAKRPMDTGMQLRFAWRVCSDQDETLPQARQQLLSNSGTWSESQRREMGQFLHNRIRWVKSQRNGEGSWLEHLQEAFDYRAWHQFQVELKKNHDSTWKRMTRHVFGTGSGGEKAVALTLPQFAAAAAHYRSAQANAPRLIMMDEVFVGVDSDMRGKCMGLLKVFDLDFVMTSEREWGTYPTVTGLAIYQLATRPGLEAVGVTRWVWNGKERQRLEAIHPQVSEDKKLDSTPF